MKLRPPTDGDRDAVLDLGVAEEAAWFGEAEVSADEVGEWVDAEGGGAPGVVAVDDDGRGGGRGRGAGAGIPPPRTPGGGVPGRPRRDGRARGRAAAVAARTATRRRADDLRRRPRATCSVRAPRAAPPPVVLHARASGQLRAGAGTRVPRGRRRRAVPPGTG